MRSSVLSPLALLLVLCAFLCSVRAQSTVFQFTLQANINNSIYGRVDSFLASVVQPVVYEVNGQQTQVAGLGSWVLWGTQPDVELTLNNGSSFTTIAGSSAFTYLGNVAWENDFGSAYGGNGCAHRNTFNRFYYMGNISNVLFNWASADGSTWLNILDPATAAAWANRLDFQYTGCVVTAQDVVISIGATDNWVSTNLGVTFTAVSSTTRFSSRQFFGSAIYSPVGGGADVMVVAGGRDYVTAASPYGGNDHNDVYSSTNLGATWTTLTTAAPWQARDSLNFGISAAGVMVMHGGSIYGGSAGWLGDLWVSVNGGSVWTQIAATTNVGACSQSTIMFDGAGYMYIFFGQYPGYNWVTEAFKSTLSFNNIQTWGPQVNSTFPAFPSTYPLAVNSSSQTFSAPVYQTFPQLVQSTCTSSSSNLPVASAGSQFTYVQQPNAGVYSRAASTIAPITAPLTYPIPYQSNNAIDWAVAPTGSWLLWGTQQDVSISTNFGQTWNLIAGVTYANLPSPGITDFGAAYGSNQCQHRATFNRFYVIGNAAASSYYVWASNNGWEWINVVDNATSTAFAARQNVNWAACVVDVNDRVYSIGGSDVWISTNLGVTFTPRNTNANNMFTPRTYFGAGIFTNSTATGNRGDVMVVLGGRQPVTAANPYGGSDLNDVWISTNYAYGWTLVSAAAPWSARDSPNVAVSNYGVIALYGGSYYGGSGGWLDDTWVSLDGGYLWTMVSGSGSLNNRSQASILIDHLGYLNIWFGQECCNYNWSTDGWRSTYSFNSIQQWGPVVQPAFSLTTLSPGYSACAPINYQGVTSGAGTSTGAGPTAPTSSSSSSSLSGGAIAGIVIGSVVGALIILVVLLLLCGVLGGGMRRSKKATNTEPSTGTGRFSNVGEDSHVEQETHTADVEMH